MQRQLRIRLVVGLSAFLVGLGASLSVDAQEDASAYPSRSVKLVVPYAPGGFPDVVARVVADRLGEQLGQPFLVENKTGAAGIVAADYVAKSAPDGYTLLLTDAQLWGITPAITKNPPFKPETDFEPVGLLATVSNYFTIISSLPVSNFNEFVTLVKSKPLQYNYGSVGVGSITHLAMEYIMSLTQMKMVHVPYRGSSQVVPALLAGEVVASASLSMSVLRSHWQEGTLKVLAVTSAKRSKMTPDVKTFAELGLPEVDFTGSVGALAPGGTSPNIVAKLSAEFSKAVNYPTSVQRLAAIGVEPVGSTPSEFVVIMRKDRERYAKAAQAAGLEQQ